MSGMDEELPPPNIDQSGHTTSRKSARGARVEVITRGERRRSWTAEQKCQIVAESLGPELTPAEVARKYAIGSGQLYTWRRQLLSVLPGAVMTRPAPRFVQVELASASRSFASAACSGKASNHIGGIAQQKAGVTRRRAWKTALQWADRSWPVRPAAP